MQERKGEKLPYSFKIFPVPGMIRDCWSAQPQLWSCRGEKRELILSEGHEIKFITSMAIFHKGTKLEGHGRRQFAPSDEASYQMALTKLAKAGLDSRQIVVSGPEFVHIDKGNARRGFMLPVFTVQGAATISNQQEAEMAIVYGVGPKRVFGCGFMHLAGE